MFMYQNQEKKYSFDSLYEYIYTREKAADLTGLSGSEKAFIVSRYYLKCMLPVVVVLSSVKDGERFIQDLNFFSTGHIIPVVLFPPYNDSPFKFVSYHNETAATRINALYNIAGSDTPPVIVTTPEALLQKLIPKQKLFSFAELVMEGEETDRERLMEKLVSGGYSRSMIVEESGDYCVRGGILDIFTPSYPDPLRIEFLGDMVESIRLFSASSQRTLTNIPEAVILPAREAIYNKEDLNLIISRIREQASKLDIPITKTRDLIDRIKREGVLPDIESLIPLVYSKLDSFFDYLAENTLFVQDEPEQLQKEAEEVERLELKNYVSAREDRRLCVEPGSLYLTWANIRETINSKKLLNFRALKIVCEDEEENGCCLQCDYFIKDNNLLIQEIKCRIEKDHHLMPLADWINENKTSAHITLVVCSTKSQAERIKSLLTPYGIQLETKEGFPVNLRGKGGIFICLGRISSGFVWPEESLAIITEDEIFGAKKSRRRDSARKTASQIISFEDLKKTDLVVHDDHGIGQYEGLVKLKLNGSTNDFLLIVYKDGDKLYLPVERMNVVHKYMGIDGLEPVLDRMGGKSWDKIKERVKKSAEIIAGELLKLYALRKVSDGYGYGMPDSYFKDFEAGFTYEETPDQLKAIDDVLSDMERPMPMDRLVCGDVGYGKTEVALRASFLAVNSGKQVVVLVPTTVLAEQHFATFSLRFERYPVNIACLSRFRSVRDQKSIISDLESGKIDIVIGTHRLLQKDVVFKDLGLVVLDEEQRFGVKHKEKLKKLRNTVDVLALTATPIPRTLHMSLMGVRDISIISTPPEHRQSIITYVSELDDAIVAGAVRKELSRKGQIFFVHNNIYTIEKTSRKLQELVPEARIGIAHGRLDEDELENVMFKFMEKEIDMLVCTTIIESGLDIPSANTILVNRADKLGLAQIYQLRGRVGRADEQAYAYLFIPKESAITKDAQKRLKVLMEHSDLGSGFQIAMSDLRIRGGGTILGASQSGHIAAVGYEMFLKLMENAMSELKGEPVQKTLDPEINVSISAYLPESYMPDIDQRLTSYRRLAKMTEIKEMADFKAELTDRFGALPEEASNLLLKIMLKVLSQKAGVKRLDLRDQQLFLHFAEPSYINNPSDILNMVVSDKNRFEFTPEHVLKVRLAKQSITGHIVKAKNILKEIIQRVNG
ncbi:MAG: transcription-repair coupling factor [Proteobacteria bacterium]|nr:transcription-repair coupling factor [Pseudomonadota bacterium]